MTIYSGDLLPPARLNALNAPRCGVQLRRSGQSVASATTTAISWDTEDVDTDGFFAPTGTTITVPSGLSGIYVVTYVAEVASLTTGTRCFGSINISSSITGLPSIVRSVYDTAEDRVAVTYGGPLAAADTLTGDIFHSQGSALNVSAWLCAYRIGA